MRIHEQNLNFENFVKGGDLNQLHEIIYNLKKGLYKCASLKNDYWYVFKDHRWKGTYASDIISKIIADLSAEYVCYRDLLKRLELEYGKDKYAALIDIENKLEKISTATFKKNLTVSCSNLFYDREFEKKLDQNPDLIGYLNGVYDIKNCYFRAGVPEYYIYSTQINCDYCEYDTAPGIKVVEDFLNSQTEEQIKLINVLINII